MRGLERIWKTARGAALLAVALFVMAGVRSQVMQVAMAAPVSVCGMAMAGMDAPASPAPGKAHKTCEFCAASAHAPLQADAPRSLPPVSVASIPPYATQAGLGPRGPPAVTPKARGPPALLLTA